jgi:hypothetical protein
MSALSNFSNWVQTAGPSTAAAARPSSATPSNGAAPIKSQNASRQAEVKNRLAALIGPFKEAVALNGPNVAKMQSLMADIKIHVTKGNFEQATKKLDELEPIVRLEPGLVASLKASKDTMKMAVTNRLGALVGPYKEAVALKGPNVAKMQSLRGEIKGHIAKGNFEQAAKKLDELEPLVHRALSAAKAPPAAVPEEEEFEATPMALPGKAPELPAPRKPRREARPSSEFAQYAPGGFTDEDIYGDPAKRKAEEAEKRKANPRLLDVDDAPWIKDSAKQNNQVLPERYPNLVEVTDGKSGETRKLKSSEVLKSKDYVDNGIQSFSGKINKPWTLEDVTMRIICSGGRIITLPLDSRSPRWPEQKSKSKSLGAKRKRCRRSRSARRRWEAR